MHIKKIKNESGRSMLEMLGVLALAGILSLAGIIGYRYALTKYQANELIDEVRMRIISVSDVLNSGHIQTGVIQHGWPDITRLGYPVQAMIAAENPDYFKIDVQQVNPAVCQQVLRDYTTPALIQVNGVAYNADVAVCGESPATMVFVYPNDMRQQAACSDKGYLSADDFQCHCLGNTYLDSSSNACLCPAGYIWNTTTQRCVESACSDGFFESLKDGCIPCEDGGLYPALQQKCDVCPQRIWESQGRYCALKDKCIKGVSFPVVTSFGFSGCHLCSDPADAFVAGDPWGREWCDACGNRHVTSYGACVITQLCEEGKQLRYMTSSGMNSNCQNACDSIEKFLIGTGPNERKLCEACLNDVGQKNREVSAMYCVKSICDSDEFKGQDGGCYKCTQEPAIFVGDSAALKAGCEVESCGRQVVNGQCQIRDCSNGVRLPSGACYACDYVGGFYITSAAEEALCMACPNRHVSDFMGTKYCVLTRCQSGTSFLQYDGKYCHGCGDSRSLIVGMGSYEKGLCNDCPNRIALSSGACAFKRCVPGLQGMLSTGDCFSCTANTAQRIGIDAYTQGLCQLCDIPHFYSGDYCYRCDTPEKPDAITSEDMRGCRLCANRDVKNGKCVLKI